VAAVLAFVIGGEHESLTLFLINAGYHTLQFTTMGLVLGLWH
jgi:hypothetical protein